MSESHDFDSIPIIDLAEASSPTTRPHLLGQLHHSLTSVGFLYVKNHGIPDSCVAAMVDLLPTIFRLSDLAKADVTLEQSPHFLGYSSVGSEVTAGKQDAREQFEFATELQNTWRHGQPLYEMLKGPNQVLARTSPCVCTAV